MAANGLSNIRFSDMSHKTKISLISSLVIIIYSQLIFAGLNFQLFWLFIKISLLVYMQLMCLLDLWTDNCIVALMI